MKQRTIRDHGSRNRNKDTSPDVTGEVNDARDLVSGLLGQAEVGGGCNRDKAEWDRRHLNHAQPGRKTETHTQCDVGGAVVKRNREACKTRGDKVTGCELAGCQSRQRHENQKYQSAARERLSRDCGRVAEKHLGKLRLEHGSGVEDAAHDQHQQRANSEILEPEQADIDEWVLGLPLPPDETDHAESEHAGKHTNVVGAKPSVLFPLVEHDLHASHGNCKKAETYIVEIL